MGAKYGKEYILRATKREVETGYGFSEARVNINRNTVVIVDGDGVVVLTSSQVSKLRRVIDKHFPLRTSEG